MKPAPGTGLAGLRVVLAGPLAPPAGGMANQTAQLARLLAAAGAEVLPVRSNAPPWPPSVAGVRGLRAACRLAPYLVRLWRACGQADLIHVMANSGWSWHLHAAPAVWLARIRGIGVLLNYRGGDAAAFLAHSGLARLTLRRCHAVAVASPFLAGLLARHGVAASILPNVVALPPQDAGALTVRRPCTVIVARQLEAVYDNATAIRALALLRRQVPDARLILCGGGPELPALRDLAQALGLSGHIRYTGPVGHGAMDSLYREATLMLNPSRVDNTPNSVLEALARGLPVVSTDAGGLPDLLRHGADALLVRPGDAEAMALAMARLAQDPELAQRLAQAGRDKARRYTWPLVEPRLAGLYRQVAAAGHGPLRTRLTAQALFPLHEALKGHDTLQRRRALERSQWLDGAALRLLQAGKLERLLSHAQRHVPYYRGLGLRAGAALADWPLLRKEDIRADSAAFMADGAPPLQRCHTGGSSGEPLVFHVGKERVSHDVAAKWRATRWWGVDIGDREMALWGSPIELGAQDRVRRWRDRLLNSRLLPAFAMSPAHMDRYLDQLRRWRPAMLFGYPSALCLLAGHARARGLALDGLGLRVVFVTGERLYPAQRQLLGEVFGAPVANGYGGRDAGFIAHECPSGGMHVSAEDIVVEILDRQGQPVPAGVSGNIVVTHLASGSFPFIRYLTGDIGALSEQPCPCGRGLPVLERIEGRSTDFVVAQDGTVLHGLALIYILRELPQVRAFRIIQESLALTRVQLVPDGPLAPALLDAIVAGFRARLGAATEIAIEQVDAIAAEASGKYRYVTSKVAPREHT
ncbi:glycosyltransferase [Oxalobacteraceae bacterium A2-2]